MLRDRSGRRRRRWAQRFWRPQRSRTDTRKRTAPVCTIQLGRGAGFGRLEMKAFRRSDNFAAVRAGGQHANSALAEGYGRQAANKSGKGTRLVGLWDESEVPTCLH